MTPCSLEVKRRLFLISCLWLLGSVFDHGYGDSAFLRHIGITFRHITRRHSLKSSTVGLTVLIFVRLRLLIFIRDHFLLLLLFFSLLLFPILLFLLLSSLSFLSTLVLLLLCHLVSLFVLFLSFSYLSFLWKTVLMEVETTGFSTCKLHLQRYEYASPTVSDVTGYVIVT